MARPGGSEDVLGSKAIFRREEFVRIIASTLDSLGYKKSAHQLEDESGIRVQPAGVSDLIRLVNEGKWDDSIAALHNNFKLDGTIVKSATLLILEQKFFELLHESKTMDALHVLSTEIVPLPIDHSKVSELSSCLVTNQFVGMAKSKEILLEELMNLMTPEVIVPSQKLVSLVEQVLTSQTNACEFHNPVDTRMSLCVDHHCGLDQIPSQTLQILQKHVDEVWFVQFSHNGNYLVSTSKDCTAIIWEVDEGDVTFNHRLYGHQIAVSLASWSPDDCQILTCGEKEVVRRWDVHSGCCLHFYTKPGLSMINCSWSPDGDRIITAFSDMTVSFWTLEGDELMHITAAGNDWEVIRDWKNTICISSENFALIYDLETKKRVFFLEDQLGASFSVSTDNRFLLVNRMNEGIHLYNIEGENCNTKVAKYEGHKRTRFIIRSCFGGVKEAFIASGSEDSQVYIWHRNSEVPIMILPGHSGVVNCVSWNPKNPHMLASASDDRTIRIWGTDDLCKKQKATTKPSSS